MKAHEFISRLDDAKNGHRVVEDSAPVAASPSHAPTKTAQWKTDGKGKSDDQGERMGGEKDAIKQKKTSIPTPVAAAPSHAPTSGTDATTTGKGSSEDQGEKVSKEAMKEALSGLLDGDELDIEALLGDAVVEGGHKAGCKCGFCMNKGKMGKKADAKDDDDEGDKDKMEENYGPGGMGRRPPMPGAARTMPIKRRLGGGAGRMGFRHPVRPPAKAAINPYQPAMERLDTSSNPQQAIQEIADELLEAPDAGE
jgi:hypothetical protein